MSSGAKKTVHRAIKVAAVRDWTTSPTSSVNSNLRPIMGLSNSYLPESLVAYAEAVPPQTRLPVCNCKPWPGTIGVAKWGRMARGSIQAA